MEDVRIMRKTRSQQYNVVLGADNRLIVGPNHRRVALVIGSNSVAHTRVGVMPFTSFDGGLMIPTLQRPVMFTLAEHGDMVRKAWYGWATGTTDAIGVIETVLDEQ